VSYDLSRSPVLCVAKVDTMSIRAGNVYEWHPYKVVSKYTVGERPTGRREGTLTGLDGEQPTCVCYPESAIEVICSPDYLDWI